MFKHFSGVTLNLSLNIYNHELTSGLFPALWREANVIYIFKENEDHTNPANYGPISLNSFMCKTLERMVNDRRIWYLETYYILANIQCEFCELGSPIDHLTQLDHYILTAFAKKEHVVSVFFNLEKAFKTSWRYDILAKLYEHKLRERLPQFIRNSLSNRSFCVPLPNTFSVSFCQEEGVPRVAFCQLPFLS